MTKALPKDDTVYGMRQKQNRTLAEEKFLRFVQDHWNLNTVREILKDLKLVPRDTLRNVGVSFFGNVINGGTIKRLDTLSMDLGRCKAALEYMLGLYREIQASGGDGIISLDSMKRFMEKRFSEFWKKDPEVCTGDLERVYRNSRSKDDSCKRGFLDLYSSDFLDFGLDSCSERATSSDFWAEDCKGTIDPVCRAFDGSLGLLGCSAKAGRAISRLVSCPNPKEVYPKFYDFLCGKTVESDQRISFKFVSKYLDCSEAGLLDVARRYLDKYVDYGVSLEVHVEKGLDTIKVEKIRFEKVDYDKFIHDLKEKSPFFFGGHRFLDDCDFIYDEELCRDVPYLTFVHFECSFRNRLTLLNPTTYDPYLERYRQGDFIAFGLERTLQQIRDVYDHPLELCHDRQWILCNPTEETLQQYEIKRRCHRNWSISDVAQEAYKYGDGNIRKLLLPLVGKKKIHSDVQIYGDVSLRGLEVYPGSHRDIVAYLDGLVREASLWQNLVERLTELWPEISTPIRFFGMVSKRVAVDPIAYLGSQSRSVAVFASEMIA